MSNLPPSAFSIAPSKLEGELHIPPSKSHTLRAILFALMSEGTSTIHNILPSPDTESMLEAVTKLGAKISRVENTVTISGHIQPHADLIDAGGSGIVLRFIAALCALLPSYMTITGDHALRSRRPIKPLIHALRHLGGLAESINGNGHAPILIRGPIHSGHCHLDGEDSQPVSALLIACSFLQGPTEITVENPGETPWIDLTLKWLRKFGAIITHENYRKYSIQGNLSYPGFSYTVPGDYSSAAFPIAAALITKSTLRLKGLAEDDVQGDKKLIDILQKMGARIRFKKDFLLVEPSHLHGLYIDINHCIDALPILAVIGCYAEGITTLYNGAIARKKESDRIAAICTQLKKMGAKIKEFPDGLTVEHSPLCGTVLDSHLDHRIALAIAVAALGATGPSTIERANCIEKTYPHFIEEFQKLGAAFELDLAWV